MKAMTRTLNGFRHTWLGVFPAIALLVLFSGCSGKQNSATTAAPATQPAAPHVVSYSTKFPKTESPIVEGDRWIGGKTIGLDWGNVSTKPGYANGKAGPKRFADSVALLTGDWPANQSVELVVDKRMVKRYPEVSMRLRSSLAAHNCDGYEISYSLRDDDTAYLIIVRWNGPLADFTYLVNAHGAQYG